MSTIPCVCFPKWLIENASGGTGIVAISPLNLAPITHRLTISAASAGTSGYVTTGVQAIAGAKTFVEVPSCATVPSTGSGLANKGYVDSLVATSLTWKKAVNTFYDFTPGDPPGVTLGDRYIALVTVAPFTADRIYEWNGATWTEYVTQEGWALYVEGDASPLFANQCIMYSDAGAWVSISGTMQHSALLGLSGDDHTHYVKVTGRAGDVVTIPNATASVSKITGALVTTGGIGCGERVTALKMTSETAPSAATDVMRLGDVVPAYWTGFAPGSSSQSTISTGGARSVTITPTGASYSIWQAGVKYTISAPQTTNVAAASALYYVYFDAGVLNNTSIVDDALFTKVLVAMVYYNLPLNSFTFVGDERHTYAITPEDHRYEHFSTGCAYMYGLSPADFTIGNGSLDAHARFSTSVGAVLDEDLYHLVSAHAVAGQMYGFYLTGTSWQSTLTTSACYSSGTGLFWNRLNAGTWSTQGVTDGQYVFGHLIATNDTDQTKRMAFILGQATYNSVALASNAVANEVASLYTVGLPLYEYVIVASILFQSNSGYANVYKGRIVPNSTGTNFYDWRQRKLNSTAGTVQSHSSLSGLTADVHPQYPLLAGRTGESITLNSGSLLVNGAGQKLLFDNQISRRRVVLWTAADNDYQFFGMGLQSGMLQFQVGAVTNKFSFRQGASTSADVELVAIESPLATGSVKIFHVTPSTSSVTGALLVAGGAGIGENLHVAGTANAANVTIPGGGALTFPGYSVVQMNGGNSTGYLQGDFATFGDGLVLQYNQRGNAGSTSVINPAGSTSAVQVSYGYVALRAGAAGVAATDVASASASAFTLYKPLVGGYTTTSITGTWLGYMSATNFTLFFYKTASHVTAYVGDWSSTTNGFAGSVSSMDLSIAAPTGYRPAGAMGHVVLMALNSVWFNGYFQVRDTGTITMYSLPRTSFQNSVSFNLAGFSFSYPIV